MTIVYLLNKFLCSLQTGRKRIQARAGIKIGQLRVAAKLGNDFTMPHLQDDFIFSGFKSLISSWPNFDRMLNLDMVIQFDLQIETTRWGSKGISWPSQIFSMLVASFNGLYSSLHTCFCYQKVVFPPMEYIRGFYCFLFVKS